MQRKRNKVDQKLKSKHLIGAFWSIYKIAIKMNAQIFNMIKIGDDRNATMQVLF